MAETNWDNWYLANSNMDSGADKPREPSPDWMSWIDNPLFQDSSSLTPAPPAAGRWSLSEVPEPQNIPPVEQQPSQAPISNEENISVPPEPATPPPPDRMQETRQIPAVKPEKTPSPVATPEAQSAPVPDDAETLQTFVVSSILPLTRRPGKTLRPSAPKELLNGELPQSDDVVAPQEEESPVFDEDNSQEQTFEDTISDDDAVADSEPSAVMEPEEPVEQPVEQFEPVEPEENNSSSSDTMPQEPAEPVEEQEPPETIEEYAVTPAETEEPAEQSAEETEMSSDSQPEEESAVKAGNTIAFPVQKVSREKTDNSTSSSTESASREKKQKAGFFKKIQSFLGHGPQAGQSKTSANGQRDRSPAQTRPVNPDRPHSDRPRSDRPRNDRLRPVEPARREPTRNSDIPNDRLAMQKRRETERALSKEREKKERERKRERINRKKREEERRLEMERIQTADLRDPSFRRTLSEQDIFGGAEAEYMYAFSSQRYRQNTQGRNMERSRTGSQPERRSNYSTTRSRDGQRTSSASPRSTDTSETGHQTRRTGQAQNNRSAVRGRRKKGPNYRLILCVIMLIAIVLDFVFLGMFLFQRSKATGLNGQIETLTKDKEALTTQVGTLQQENITLEANMMSALPEPTTARTDNLPDLIPQLTDGIYIIHVSEGYQYLKVPDGYLTDKINTFGNAPGYIATNTDPPTCSYYVLYADKVVGLAEGDTGLVSEDRTATGNGSSLPGGFYAFVASFFNH